MANQSMQSGSGAAAAVGGGGRGVEATTEEKARAIISMAKRAVAEAAKTREDGAAAAWKPSLKRSLECFLESRKNKATSSSPASRRRLRLAIVASSSTSPSSSPN